MSEKEKPMNSRWGSYPETVCYFQGETEVMVDLREPLALAVRKALGAIGLGGEFGVLTAHNPRGLDLDADENLERAAQLEAELKSLSLKFIPVDCCSPDRSHCECSIAIIAPRGTVLDMARRWEQIAIFWFDGAKFWIYGAIDPGQIQLPL